MVIDNIHRKLRAGAVLSLHLQQFMESSLISLQLWLYFHFTPGETEIQRNKALCPRLCSSFKWQSQDSSPGLSRFRAPKPATMPWSCCYEASEIMGVEVSSLALSWSKHCTCITSLPFPPFPLHRGCSHQECLLSHPASCQT